MAEAFAIVGATAAILQLTEFAGKVINDACGLYSSVSRHTKKDEGIQTVTSTLQKMLDDLQAQPDQDVSLSSLIDHCRALGNKLLAILEKTKAKQEHSVRESLRASIAAVCKKDEMEDLRKELDLCLNQLGVHLVAVFSSDTGKRLTQIFDGQSTEFAILRQTLSNVERDQKLALDTLGFFHEILVPSDSLLQRLNQERILKSLAFDGMGQRYADVTESTIGTFKWCYEDLGILQSHNYDDLDIRQPHPELKISLRDWLVQGQGVFHIAGKPGAGKSTLMKFIIESDETEQFLSDWAGSRTLVTANFFFWKPGSRLGKSVEGLVRTVVHAILKKVPDMMSQLFPNHWHPSNILLWHPGNLELPYRTVFEAFEKLTGDKELMKEYCFCFFIDGLDELEDRTEQDSRLVKRLKVWVDRNPDNLKICVSSREEVPFMINLSSDQRLHLHRLTKADIMKHVEKSLGEHDTFQAFSSESQADLVKSVVEKAEGVFLWVILVLRWLGDDLEDGKPLRELRKTLEQVPKELRDLFTKILASIDRKDYMQEAAAILAVIITADEHGLAFLSIFHYSFIEDFLEDKKFSERTAVLPRPRSENLDRKEKFTRHLKRLFKGLIEIDNTDMYETSEISFYSSYKQEKESSSLYSFQGSLKVVHRSIHEFLKNDCPKSMKTLIDDVDVTSVVLQCLIVHLKCVKWDQFFFYTYWDSVIMPCVRWLKMSQSEQHFDTLFALDDVLTQVQTGKSLRNGIDWSKISAFIGPYSRPSLKDWNTSNGLLLSITTWSFLIGFAKYAAWLREQHGDLFAQDRTRAETCYCLYHFILEAHETPFDRADSKDLLAALSQDGFLAIELMESVIDPGYGLTLWTVFAAMTIWELLELSFGPASHSENDYTALEIFLLLGVDPRLTFKIAEQTPVNPDPKCVNFLASIVKTMQFDNPIAYPSYSFGGVDRTTYETLKPTMMLREIVDWAKPPNHEELLRLIDLNLAQYESPTIPIYVTQAPTTDIVTVQQMNPARKEDNTVEDLNLKAGKHGRKMTSVFPKNLQILPVITGLSVVAVLVLAILLRSKQPALSVSENSG
ncbi:hypothetical protein VTL71DRAFT_8588 [Oculimacula yallundae]|uniref:NACHT domain-containing protein n=1 Tax=Oculimacula yallundae TaxID=86028 RepID=A0ABR4D0F0_9HELO